VIVNGIVLIVDDEAESREALARVLTAEGYTVRTAGDAQRATQLMAQEHVDVALLDIDLPHVPGDSFAAFVHLRYPRTRIVFISGQYDMVDPERFGVDTVYFRKPVDVKALLEALRNQPPAALA
jgi:DNA-binding NtrC family response regulator